MMHEREKSDSAIVAEKPTNKAERSAAEPVEPRAGPRGIRTSKARAGRRTGKACHRRWIAYGKRQGKGRRRGSPRSCITSIPSACGGVLCAEARRRTGVDGVTWGDYEQDLDRRLEELHGRVQRGAYRALPSRRRLHSEAGRRGSDRSRSPRWRTRSSSGRCRGAERDLRGRLPRVLVRVPAGRGQHDALDALIVGIEQQEGELDTGRRHPVVLRRSQPGMAGAVPRSIGSATDASSA